MTQLPNGTPWADVDRAMRLAAKNGDLEAFEHACRKWWLLADEYFDDHFMPWAWAASSGHLSLVQWLAMEETGDLPCGWEKAFLNAAQFGHVHVARWLLNDARCVAVLLRPDVFHVALFVAVNQDHKDMTRYLCDCPVMPEAVLTKSMRLYRFYHRHWAVAMIAAALARRRRWSGLRAAWFGGAAAAARASPRCTSLHLPV